MSKQSDFDNLVILIIKVTNLQQMICKNNQIQELKISLFENLMNDYFNINNHNHQIQIFKNHLLLMKMNKLEINKDMEMMIKHVCNKDKIITII